MNNCRNCGAPYTGKARCEWCGTVRQEAADIESEILRLEQEIEREKLVASLSAATSLIIESLDISW